MELLTADEFRSVFVRRFEGMTHAEIGELLQLSAGFVGMVLTGHREPSKAFLNAVGYERVIFYRLKGSV